MFRFGVFVCFVSALYVIGQKQEALPQAQPVVVPMTLSLDGTWIGAPKRSDTSWRSDSRGRDFSSTPAGFHLQNAALDQSILIAAPALDN